MARSQSMMAALDARAEVLHTTRGDVQVARSGQGPPVLVVHGGRGGFDQALMWCRHLRDGGCHVIAPSRPGYLRTPLASGRAPAEQADLYAALLDALRIERAMVLGFSSGGPSAVHFAARHPERTAALALDAPILMPFPAPLGPFERVASESRAAVWLARQVAAKRSGVLAPYFVDACSDGMRRDQRRAATEWIRADAGRLRMVAELTACGAPRRYRDAGRANDEVNETDLAPLPLDEVAATTLIAHGTHDGVVPEVHARHGAELIADAELMLIEAGHHILPLSAGYSRVARRQVALARASAGAVPSPRPHAPARYQLAGAG